MISIEEIINNTSKPIQIVNPNKHDYPLIFSIPHSGLLITEEMRNNLKKECILTSMDWYLPQLYDFLGEGGFTVIINNVSRYVVDPNRSIEEKPEDFSYLHNSIYTQTTFDKDMYIKPLTQGEIQKRIENYYIPYHKELENQIEKKLNHFDKVYLIDMHSFGRNVGADIVLGNDYGNTTSPDFLNLIKNKLENEGFSISENIPYRGGYITRHYNEKYRNVETLQIELYYGCYIERREFGEEYHPAIDEEVFNAAKERMKKVFENLKHV